MIVLQTSVVDVSVHAINQCGGFAIHREWATRDCPLATTRSSSGETSGRFRITSQEARFRNGCIVRRSLAEVIRQGRRSQCGALSGTAQAQIDAIVRQLATQTSPSDEIELTSQGEVLLYGYAGHCEILALRPQRPCLHALHRKLCETLPKCGVQADACSVANPSLCAYTNLLSLAQC